MKGGFVAAVAAMAGGAAANNVHHRHAHDIFANKRGGDDLCTTVWTTITGAPILLPPATTTVRNTTTSTKSIHVPPPTSVAPPLTTDIVPAPTAHPHTCPTAGTYTFSATTLTVDKTTTVCDATSTQVPSGTHTLGGVTTVVKESTTVTCPYATVKTSGTVTTSAIETTEYVCPSAGTYTVAPITTVVPTDTVVVFPTPTSYAPGTYTAPQQVVTVTEDNYVYYCPYSSSETPTPEPTPEPTTVAPAPVAPTSTQESKPKPTTPKPGNGDIGSTGDHLGVTYNPYDRDTGDCLSKDQVKEDIREIKQDGFNVVRTYSTDCNTLESVGEAVEEQGMKMIIGVFVKETGCSYESQDVKEQVDAISQWAKWDIVQLFVVGNEAIMNDYCSADELANLITDIKSKCSGYGGPYTITETLNIWQQPEVSGALCDVVDVTGANIHPYFNPETTPALAGEFVSSQLELLKGICSNKDVINLECGWPTQGKCNGSACPSEKNQAEAIKSIREKAGSKTIFFSMWSELWKTDGDCGCERSWGAKTCFSS